MKMSRTVTNNAEFLRALRSLKPKYRLALLKNTDCSSIKCICECTYNILQGKIPLSRKQRVALRRHKNVLRKLVKRGENWKKKKRILVQSGGAILPLLLGPLLGGVLSTLFKN